jgi:hypothetical protein
MFCESFLKKSAAALVRFAQMAAKTIPVEGEFTQEELRWAWEHVQCSSQRLTTRAFSNLGSGDVCRKNEIRLTAVLARVNPENFANTEPTAARNNTAWLAEQVAGKVAMSDDEMAAWCETPAAKELMAVADQRHETWRTLYQFENADRKLVVGEYRNITVFVETRAAWGSAVPDTEAAEKAMTLAKLYINAAFSLQPDFRSAGFNAAYGLNNLPYLAGEYEESGQLYRVFVPFLSAPEGTAEVEAAKEVALMRPLLEPPEEPEYPLTPEVQRLLDLVPPYEEE